jgi:hypothetical protein
VASMDSLRGFLQGYSDARLTKLSKTLRQASDRMAEVVVAMTTAKLPKSRTWTDSEVKHGREIARTWQPTGNIELGPLGDAWRFGMTGFAFEVLDMGTRAGLIEPDEELLALSPIGDTSAASDDDD